MKDHFPAINVDYNNQRSLEEWNKARSKTQAEIQDKMKETEANQLKMTQYIKDAKDAITAGLTKDQFKDKLLKDVTKMVDLEADKEVLDDAWEKAGR